mmetsp:Transcript_15481/g.48666  ORF Transcript_15481/g.48666 Transcript_15481/m.48666 type:complete len:202 (-) Transcript_15481:301-906(-)
MRHGLGLWHATAAMESSTPTQAALVVAATPRRAGRTGMAALAQTTRASPSVTARGAQAKRGVPSGAAWQISPAGATTRAALVVPAAAAPGRSLRRASRARWRHARRAPAAPTSCLGALATSATTVLSPTRCLTQGTPAAARQCRALRTPRGPTSPADALATGDLLVALLLRASPPSSPATASAPRPPRPTRPRYPLAPRPR